LTFALTENFLSYRGMLLTQVFTPLYCVAIHVLTEKFLGHCNIELD
jgi:hypothetical protein